MTAARRCVISAICACFPFAVFAQGQPTGAFIVRLGSDTTAVERFTRSGNSYQVEQALRSPRTSFRHTHLEVTPTGHVATTFLMLHSIDNPSGPLLGSTKLTHGAGDSASVEIKQGDSTRTRRVPLPAGAIPSLPQAFLGYELAATRMRATKADSMSITLVNPSGDPTPIVVRRVGRDSMTFTLPFLTYRAQVDASGRITRLYQPRGTSVERVPNVDVNAVAKAWAALDAAGKGMGPLSPRDSTSARIGDATISVRYARPSKRGRAIFGDIVPWDTVWRTGANDATVFTSDTDLLIGNEMVHAGSYTLFTIPSRNGTTLIINREIMRGGEPLAGTDYDASKDLARIPMTTKALAAPVEKLTIEVVPRGNEGVLRIVWDRREMTVPIRLRS